MLFEPGKVSIIHIPPLTRILVTHDPQAIYRQGSSATFAYYLVMGSLTTSEKGLHRRAHVEEIDQTQNQILSAQVRLFLNFTLTQHGMP